MFFFCNFWKIFLQSHSDGLSVTCKLPWQILLQCFSIDSVHNTQGKAPHFAVGTWSVSLDSAASVSTHFFTNLLNLSRANECFDETVFCQSSFASWSYRSSSGYVIGNCAALAKPDLPTDLQHLLTRSISNLILTSKDNEFRGSCLTNFPCFAWKGSLWMFCFIACFKKRLRERDWRNLFYPMDFPSRVWNCRLLGWMFECE